MPSSTIAESLLLPCGAVLPNRLAKAAMTEGLADPWGRATPELARLYGLWADGGSGLLITGNVQIDGDHLERPGNVIIEGPQDAAALAGLRAMAEAGKRAGGHIWMQISHAGRQTQVTVNPHPKAPSLYSLPEGEALLRLSGARTATPDFCRYGAIDQCPVSVAFYCVDVSGFHLLATINLHNGNGRASRGSPSLECFFTSQSPAAHFQTGPAAMQEMISPLGASLALARAAVNFGRAVPPGPSVS